MAKLYRYTFADIRPAPEGNVEDYVYAPSEADARMIYLKRLEEAHPVDMSLTVVPDHIKIFRERW